MAAVPRLLLAAATCGHITALAAEQLRQNMGRLHCHTNSELMPWPNCCCVAKFLEHRNCSGQSIIAREMLSAQPSGPAQSRTTNEAVAVSQHVSTRLPHHRNGHGTAMATEQVGPMHQGMPCDHVRGHGTWRLAPLQVQQTLLWNNAALAKRCTGSKH